MTPESDIDNVLVLGWTQDSDKASPDISGMKFCPINANTWLSGYHAIGTSETADLARLLRSRGPSLPQGAWRSSTREQD